MTNVVSNHCTNVTWIFLNMTVTVGIASGLFLYILMYKAYKIKYEIRNHSQRTLGLHIYKYCLSLCPNAWNHFLFALPSKFLAKEAKLFGTSDNLLH